jgi:hypothetical protein
LFQHCAITKNGILKSNCFPVKRKGIGGRAIDITASLLVIGVSAKKFGGNYHVAKNVVDLSRCSVR